jgi:ribosomal protein S13
MKYKGLGNMHKSFLIKYLGLNTNKKGLEFTKRLELKNNFLIKEEFYIGENIVIDQYYHNQNEILIPSWKNTRKKLGLPCRGQRTKTNAGTLKNKFKNRKKEQIK